MPLPSLLTPIGGLTLAAALGLGFAQIHAGTAQTTPPPQLSPEAAYAQALQPLTLTRGSEANWSETELAALHIAVDQARVACTARPPENFTGDALLALASLCSFGQQWPAVSKAAGRYIHDYIQDQPSQHTSLLSQAYALTIDAALHQHDSAAALAASQTMLATLPYDTTADQALNETLRSLQFAHMTDALHLYAAREPILLAALRAETKPTVETAAPSLSRTTLYADGLAYAALQQFAGQPTNAADTVEALNDALSTPSTALQPDDAIAIAAARRQYALLGKPLPAIPITLSLYAPNDPPRINTDYGSSTVLLLFPPWCAQCVRMGQSIMNSLFRLKDRDVHIDALLAQDPPPVPAWPDLPDRAPIQPKQKKHPCPDPAPEITPAPAPRSTVDQLRHTPTLIVPVQTLEQFAATAPPLLIATDSKGILRFLQPAPEDALEPGGFLDQVTAHIAAQWPPQQH